MASEKNTTENEKTNKFANDGSFMEMFRKKMEEEQRRKRGEKSTEPQKTSTDTTRGCIDTRVSQSAVRKPELSNQQPQGIHSTSKCSSSVSEDRVQTDNGGGGLHSSAFSSTLVGKKPGTMSFVGKRRGNIKALKTGAVVKKSKTDDNETGESSKDGWSQYLAEVNRYKSQLCNDDDKTRPLVK